MSQEKRGFAARIGIILLNLLAPGLGLIRLERPWLALRFYALSIAALLGIVGVFAVAPTLTFQFWATTVGVAILVGLTAIVGSMWLSWRESGFVADQKPYWARWYSISRLLWPHLA